MNSSLSFRKESIQRSSSASEALSHALEAQGQRPASEERRFSITVTVTATL